jgi:hypothetical protein
MRRTALPTVNPVTTALPRRRLLAAGALGTVALLAGCATISTVSTEVSTFGDWPAGRAPGSFAFERLPSQQAQVEQMQVLEDAARAALEQAGFTPVAEGTPPDVLVQVGARSSRAELQPWDDPLWWRGGFGYWRRPWLGPGWHAHLHATPARWEREVAVLIRDRESGQPLFEARASSEGTLRLDGALLGAMFKAAMLDFPRRGINPRTVRVPLS